jgi:hypothetical protein
MRAWCEKNNSAHYGREEAKKVQGEKGIFDARTKLCRGTKGLHNRAVLAGSGLLVYTLDIDR